MFLEPYHLQDADGTIWAPKQQLKVSAIDRAQMRLRTRFKIREGTGLVCMYVWTDVWQDGWMHVRIYVPKKYAMSICICMYVIYIYINI